MTNKPHLTLIQIISAMLIFMAFPSILLSQVENVPVGEPVYRFLKDMRVRGIIKKYDDGISGLSRFQVSDYLKEIESGSEKLSRTEKALLKKYRVEYDADLINENTATSLFGGNYDMSKGFDEIFTDKKKYLFAYKKGLNNVFFTGGGHLGYSNSLTPDAGQNAEIFDVGFDIRGTLFGKLGYDFFVLKGGVSGDTALAEYMLPELRTSFKYLENIENIKNYDFAKGYLKYYAEPDEGMSIAGQFGREKVKLGYGYSSSLIMSGNAPDFDFLRLQFKYGIINYYSFFGSGTGPFVTERTKNYTKYIASNRLMLSFEKLFDVGIGETVVFSDRLELAYLNPVIFYKFVEMSLQDRDNGMIYFDMQTHFLDDVEFQGTFLLDENILSNLGDFSRYSNRTGYQLGGYWYRPVSIENIGLTFEYTKLRPFVYSHYNIKNAYTSHGQIIGHPIGPNSDQIFAALDYSISDRLFLRAEYQFVRSGENILDSAGTLVRNVGGDVNQTHRTGIDPTEAYFLDGIRINNSIFSVRLTYEPIRNYRFDLYYSYNSEKNLTSGKSRDYSYAYGLFTLGF